MSNEKKPFDPESFIDANVTIELSDAHGQYIPQIFREHFPQANIETDDWDAIADPDGDWYWEGWINVLDNYESNGRILHQSGDLFSIDKNALDKLSDEQSEQFWDYLA